MSGMYTVDPEEFYILEKQIKEYGEGAEDRLNEVIHGYAGERIQDEAQVLINKSGRNWKGKPRSAKTANPFISKDKNNLTVTVTSKSNYHYLYFPDDGTTTRKHAGKQHFMQRGAESAKQSILDRCVAALLKEE